MKYQIIIKQLDVFNKITDKLEERIIDASEYSGHLIQSDKRAIEYGIYTLQNILEDMDK